MNEESNSTTSTENSTWSGIKQKMKKAAFWLLFIVVLITAIFIFWEYFYTYSDGYRSGLLQKFSRKGNVFKTYEAEMIQSSVSSSENVALTSEKFYFSVSDEDVARQLDTLQGQMVIVHYEQKNSTLFWRGDSEYLVDSVRLVVDR